MVAVAKQYQGRGVAWEHLLAAGQQGLIRAWETYDGHPDRLERMGSWWVRQTIVTTCAAYPPS
ncbi:hypothetical protein [Hymenobacter lutimineralis]|uniref:hypothetical protein n=1 Tax=Hymenobacter lutimineralis TaxID=2606448 RepID=UPI003570C4C5